MQVDSAKQDRTSKTGSRKPRKTEKHIAAPATAEELRRGLGITRKERALVRKVLTDLGYIGKKSVKRQAAAASSHPRKS